MTVLRLFCFALLTLAAGAAFAAVNPHSPTPQQKHRLDQFGYEVFQSSLAGLENESGEVSEKALVKRFGRPLRHYTVLRRDPDPRPGEPAAVEWVTWYFRGLALAMSHVAATSGGARHAPLVIVGVSVISPGYVLQHGLRVGDARSRFISVLGPPTYQDHRRVRYDVENAARVAPDAYDVAPYQIEMDLDSSDRVRRIVWSWWTD